MNLSNVSLALAAFLTALIVGLFFAWSISVVRGLLRVSDSGYISAMQQINRAIQNPIFFIAFFGAQIFLPLSAFLYYPHVHRFPLLLGATLLYTFGVMGVTVFGNVPMNNSLDQFDLDGAKPEDISQQRKEYETPWNRLNNVRTISSSLALILVIVACLCRD